MSRDNKFDKQDGPEEARQVSEEYSQELLELLVSALHKLNESIESLNSIFLEEEPQNLPSTHKPPTHPDDQAILRELDDLDIQLPQPTIH
jgi:hypothetical protein